MDEEIKTMDIKEFVNEGYLQELNRQFLHPLGVALSVKIDDDGNYSLDSIWDCREDDGGIYYDFKNSDKERCEKAYKKYKNIDKIRQDRESKRIQAMGYFIENIFPHKRMQENKSCKCNKEGGAVK